MKVWKVIVMWREGPAAPEYRLTVDKETAEAVKEEAREQARVYDPYCEGFRGVEVVEEPNPPVEWLKQKLAQVERRRQWLEAERLWLKEKIGDR